MDNWRPINHGRYGHIDVYQSADSARWVIESSEETATLPYNWAVCERVPDERIPDEPITADGLRDAGWEPDSWVIGMWKMKCTNALGETSYLFWNEERGNSDYPGCTTISQLRNLVEMLGGDA